MKRLVAALLAVLLAGDAFAQDAGAPDAVPPGSAAAGAGKVWSSCAEYLPEGATRPKVESKLPTRSLSGYAVELVVIVTHGPGETVMPDGFRIQRGSDAMVALRESGWVIPEADGGAAPLVDRPEEGASVATTNIVIPFVPLPEEPGRHRMVLPPLPISVARANGQVMTLCTARHLITIEDPIANEVDPKVKGNPPPLPQTEEWSTARNFTYGALLVIALALVLAWLLQRYRSRPKVVPPKPKVVPWLAAMRQLDELRRSPLLDEGEYNEYFDRVEHTTRWYLGERYGFDGLESTSEEIRASLKRVYPPIADPAPVDSFLADADFVKYAEVVPRREDCEQAIARAEAIVRASTPSHAVSLARDGGDDPRRAA